MTRKNLWDWHRHGVSTLSLRDDEFPPVGVGCLAAPLYAQAHAFRARTRCGAQPALPVAPTPTRG